jgi:hypothetical protein
MKENINRWGNEEKPETMSFLLIKDHLSPRKKKRMVQNLPCKLTTHTSIGKARERYMKHHTTAPTSIRYSLERSGANIAYISESLGHTDLENNRNFLASFEKEEE